MLWSSTNIRALCSAPKIFRLRFLNILIYVLAAVHFVYTTCTRLDGETAQPQDGCAPMSSPAFDSIFWHKSCKFQPAFPHGFNENTRETSFPAPVPAAKLRLSGLDVLNRLSLPGAAVRSSVRSMFYELYHLWKAISTLVLSLILLVANLVAYLMRTLLVIERHFIKLSGRVDDLLLGLIKYSFWFLGTPVRALQVKEHRPSGSIVSVLVSFANLLVHLTHLVKSVLFFCHSMMSFTPSYLAGIIMALA